MYDRMKGKIMVFFAVLLWVAIVICGPLLIIWALNTLFPGLAIPYDFDTWLAVVVVTGALKANVNVKKE